MGDVDVRVGVDGRSELAGEAGPLHDQVEAGVCEDVQELFDRGRVVGLALGASGAVREHPVVFEAAVVDAPREERRVVDPVAVALVDAGPAASAHRWRGLRERLGVIGAAVQRHGLGVLLALLVGVFGFGAADQQD